MFTKPQIHLASIFIKIFYRDRQSLFFSLLFPIIFTCIFLFSGGEPNPTKIGLVNKSENELSLKFVERVKKEKTFTIKEGSELELKEELIAAEQTAIIIIPKNFNEFPDPGTLRLLLDASQVRQVGAIRDSLEAVLLSIERDIRNIEPMFSLQLEDVKSRPQRYIDFLLPGILAYMLMNLCIAGSGFNIVEYRRRGILKRLFVTPIQPKDFIISIVLARMFIIIMQLSVILGLAIGLLKINIVGGLLPLYGVILFGAFIFLCVGFFLGSLAKTQESIRPLVLLFTFPQLILSGIFFPISYLPGLIQPIASGLPLSVIASSMRNIANDGGVLFAINFNSLGIIFWVFFSFFMATKFFVWQKVAS
jgi:ABC-2 type transport system permease protein|tara:strand:+ start:1769 stop:2857 length:1089 start_codon:yes stop_codon:yes gene_type:complete